jgi:hypothetical protein
MHLTKQALQPELLLIGERTPLALCPQALKELESNMASKCNEFKQLEHENKMLQARASLLSRVVR